MHYSLADRALLSGIELAVGRGESLAVAGESGSGKSTLLSCILGLIKPGKGEIRVNGSNIAALSGRRLERHRARNVGMVFQFGELLPELTPVENVSLSALLAGTAPHTAYEKAERLLGQLGVPYGTTPTSRLSGGERQRTAVARALMNEPAVLLADEPTGALDSRTRDEVADLLYGVPGQWGCALVVVTHDEDVAQRADARRTLRGGTLDPLAEVGS
ncbi:ABC transporter ATP-binding protein [Streptomyces sp. NPDC046716]|uniref:ABC transporter ATP-binding protein n=1 Tax=Streptomyces sp. NPDC046716 TaxID=3157093 RepID=UPI0033D047C8